MKKLYFVVCAVLIFGFANLAYARPLLAPVQAEEALPVNQVISQGQCGEEGDTAGPIQTASIAFPITQDTTQGEIVQKIRDFLGSKSVPQEEIDRFMAPETLYKALPWLNPAFGSLQEVKVQIENYLNNLPIEERAKVANDEELLKQHIAKLLYATPVSFGDDSQPGALSIYCTSCGFSNKIGGCVLGGCVSGTSNYNWGKGKIDTIRIDITFRFPWW